MSGPFYDAWKAAVSETSGYLAYFSPWFEDDKYRAQVPKGFKRTPDEEEYCAEVFDYYEERLDDEQLIFRRQKIALDGPELFKQEYPPSPKDRSLTQAARAFNLTKHPERRGAPREIKHRRDSDPIEKKRVPNQRDRLLLYREIAPPLESTTGRSEGHTS